MKKVYYRTILHQPGKDLEGDRAINLEDIYKHLNQYTWPMPISIQKVTQMITQKIETIEIRTCQ